MLTAAGAARTNSSATCPFRLVVHAGPPKTGTSALQHFIQVNALWLLKEFGIYVVSGNREVAIPLMLRRKHRKERHPFARSDWEQEVYQEMRLMLRQSHVLLSAEDFSKLTREEWDDFLHTIQGARDCLSIVLVHRKIASLWASAWVQHMRFSDHPISFPEWLLRDERSNGGSDWQLKVLSQVQRVIGREGRLFTASFDWFNSSKRSIQEFVICDAVLWDRRRGPSSCRARVRRRLQGPTNVSPPHAAVDVVRLARVLYLRARRLHPRCTSPFGLRADSDEVIRVARELPWSCGNLMASVSAAEDLWFHRTGAARVEKTPSICMLAESKMSQEHWSLIDDLLPPDCH